MHTRRGLQILIGLVLCSALLPAKNHTSSGSSSKPVHVHQYTRKDGTVVQAHDRRLPGTVPKEEHANSGGAHVSGRGSSGVTARQVGTPSEPAAVHLTV